MEPEVFEGAIGIDLGTTYSCVAVFLRDQVDVIANDLGNRITPSCVAFHNDDILIGDSAKNLLARGVPGVIYDAKRMIGSRFSDKTLKEDSKRWPFTIVEDDTGKAKIEVNFKGEQLRLAPEEISARVLAYLKRCAEAYLGKQVKKAVITVPAYFNDAQRDRTKAAAAIAGLEALRVINEPTAAALCYGLGIGTGTAAPSHLQNDDAADAPINIVVFDLGGGTFDVSVVTIDNGSFAVRATAGDTHLGGQDIDANLLRHVAADLKTRHGIDVYAQPRHLAKARAACEKVKRSLSHSTSEELALDGVLSDGDEYTLTISRAKLEELNAKVFDTCMSVVKRALKDASMKPEDIQEVILVGGSSRIPKIQDMLSQFFKGRRLCNSVNPDEAVAIGAAVQASILSSAPEQQSEKTAAVVLMDVVPLSIGVDIDDGKFDVIIPRNTTIPYKAKKEYSTVEDNQSAVDIEVYEGERPLTKHNHKLGEFALEGITRARKGVPDIEVVFSVDADGILTVTATEAMANASKNLVVQNSERLSEAEVTKMIEAAQRLSKEDTVALAAAEVTTRVKAALGELEDAVSAMPHPPSAKLEKRLAFVDRAQEWVERHIPRYTATADMEEKEKKVMKLAKKALKRVRKEAHHEGGSAKHPRLEGDEDADYQEDDSSSGDDE